MKKKLIYIEWADAIMNSEWFEENLVRGWIDQSDWWICEVGWLIEETKKHIILAMRRKKEDINTVGQWGGLHKIPKTWIRKRKELKV